MFRVRYNYIIIRQNKSKKEPDTISGSFSIKLKDKLMATFNTIYNYLTFRNVLDFYIYIIYKQKCLHIIHFDKG